MLAAGAVFSDMTSKLMVSHACSQKYRPWYQVIALFAAAPVLTLLHDAG